MIEHNNTRRDFLKKTGTLIGLGLFSGPVIASLCSCEKDEFTPVPDQSLKINLNNSAFSALLTVGGIVIANADGANNTKIPLAIKRIAATEFGVFEPVCPHRKVPIQKGSTPTSDYHCPAHNADFSPETGLVTANPSNVSVTALKKYNYTFDPAKNILSIDVKS